MDKHEEKFITICTIVLLVIFCAVFVVVWGYYSDWFTTSFEFVFVSSGSQRLHQDAVYRLGDVRLDVRQFGLKHGYSVYVVPVSEEDFVYNVDGVPHSYLDTLLGKDVSAAFGIVQGESSFELHAKDMFLEDMLQAVYPGRDVQIVLAPQQAVMYKLVVTGHDGKHCCELMFYCRGIAGIEVVPDHVVF